MEEQEARDHDHHTEGNNAGTNNLKKEKKTLKLEKDEDNTEINSKEYHNKKSAITIITLNATMPVLTI